jgi:thioredoxin-like negative regulator of GroEL
MSYGCAHCRVIQPVLEGVAETLQTTERIYQVNIAVERELASAFGIEGTPTFVMFSDGREVARVAGPRPDEESLLAALTQPFA